MFTEIPVDVLHVVVALLTPSEAMPLARACRQLKSITEDTHQTVDVSPDRFEETLLSIKDGGTIRLSGHYHIKGRDIVVRKSLRIVGTGSDNACIHLDRGGRIIWCAVGLVTGITLHRSKGEQGCVYPDATICVRGLGRLQIQDCTFRHTIPDVSVLAYGLHIDFGGGARLDDVRFFETPGPCIKVVAGTVDVTRGVFVLPRVGPPILAVRGMVRVAKCTALQSFVTRPPLIWLADGATAHITGTKFAKIRRIGCCALSL